MLKYTKMFLEKRFGGVYKLRMTTCDKLYYRMFQRLQLRTNRTQTSA